MNQRRIVLILAICLAVAWTAWLAYAAYTAGDPVVVSRPQILIAPIILEGAVIRLADGGVAVQVNRIYRGQEVLGIPAKDQPQGALQLRIEGLSADAAGDVILPLRPSDVEPGAYALVPTPTGLGHRVGHTPYYPATESTRLQVQTLLDALR
jgi:hypothetical protein